MAENVTGVVYLTGKPLHPGEPVYVLRATNPLAPEILDEYALRCEKASVAPESVERVRLAAARIRAWQALNPHLVELPN
jgi:hypothetical protein